MSIFSTWDNQTDFMVSFSFKNLSQRFFYLLIISILFQSCQKENQEELRPLTENEPKKSWFLSYEIPYLDISESNISASKVYSLRGENDVEIGSSIYFDTPSINIIISRLFDGTVVEIIGTIGNHTFGVQNGLMSICGGAKNITFNYNLILQ